MIYQGPQIPSGSMSYSAANGVLHARMAYGWRQIAAMRAHRIGASFDQALVDEAMEMARYHEARSNRANKNGSPRCVMIMPADGGDPFRI